MMMQMVVVGTVFLCVLGYVSTASAQRTDAPEATHHIGRPTHYPDGSPYQAGRPPLKQRPVGAQAVIRTVADAMGFVRQEPGQPENVTDINRLQWLGYGSMTDGGRRYQVTKYSYEISLSQNAAREDIQRAADGATERIVRVVKGNTAWDESSPGVGGRYVDGQAKNRLLQLARTPFGFTRAIIDAGPSGVKITDPGPGGTVTIEVPVEGVPTIATLNREYRPSTITQRIGGQTIVATYPDYFDVAEYGVMFPTKVVESVNGQVTLDVTIDEGRVASYVVFPAPQRAAGK